MTLLDHWTTKMASADKTFYKALGKQIAQFRKAQELTQTQLAEIIGISQQTLAHYEVGRLRISVESLATVAKALTTTVEELLREQTPITSGKRGPMSLLQRQIEQVSHLPRAKQKFVSDMLDSVLHQVNG